MLEENVLRAILRHLSRMGVLVLTVMLMLSMGSVDGYAQKRKGKNDKNHQVDPEAAKKKYLMELAKFWSFGYENFKNKQYQDAIKHFWNVVELDTIDRFKKVYRYLGDSYFKQENLDSAQYVYELGLEKYPENVYLHRMVGFFQTNRGLVDEAITEYETIVELEPEAEGDWMRLAALYVKADRIEDAIRAYDKVLGIDPDNLEARNNKTALIAATGDIEAVIKEKEITREKDSQNSQVRFELGKMYFDQSEYEIAIERFREYLQLIPNDVAALENIGVAYQRLERHGDAIAEFKKIIAIAPDNKKITAEISRCYKNLGQFRAARTYANKALAIDREYGLAWIALGELYEAAAEKCVEQNDGKIDFDAKLVFELADTKYRKALKDLQFRSEAERHRSYLKAVLPTNEDKFMHKGQTKARADCYAWIY